MPSWSIAPSRPLSERRPGRFGRRTIWCSRQAPAPPDSHNVRRDFRTVCRAAGIGDRWVPKELRTSFVSVMSHCGVPVEEIARLAGHSSTRTTEVIYRRELRPVITTGAEVMDQIFGEMKIA